MTVDLSILERRLAEREARCSIESYCVKTSDDWYDTSLHDPDAYDDLRDAVRYLDMRGLIDRKEGAPCIVRAKEAP